MDPRHHDAQRAGPSPEVPTRSIPWSRWNTRLHSLLVLVLAPMLWAPMACVPGIDVIEPPNVEPDTALDSQGFAGGPFLPASKTFELWVGSPTDWSIAHTAPWISLSKSYGHLGYYEITTIVVSVNALANELPGGNYYDTLVFHTDHGQTLRFVNLVVTPTQSQATGAGGPSRVARLAVLSADGHRVLDPQQGPPDAEVPEDRADGDVLDPWMDGPATYVANSGRDSNDGRSPEFPFRSIERALSTPIVGNGRGRVLLHRGDAWTVSAPLSAPHGSRPLDFGAYGSGADPVLRLDPRGIGGDVRIEDVRILTRSGP